jgi:hypothetical protein
MQKLKIIYRKMLILEKVQGDFELKHLLIAAVIGIVVGFPVFSMGGVNITWPDKEKSEVNLAEKYWRRIPYTLPSNEATDAAIVYNDMLEEVMYNGELDELEKIDGGIWYLIQLMLVPGALEELCNLYPNLAEDLIAYFCATYLYVLGVIDRECNSTQAPGL